MEFSGSLHPQAAMFVFSFVGVVAANVDVPETGTADEVFFLAKTMNVVLPPNLIVVQMLWTMGTYRDSFSSHFYGGCEWDSSFAFY